MYKNQEGYNDPTAGEVIRDYNRMPHHMKEALNALKRIAHLLGFEIIAVKDIKTGKEYR